MRFKDVLNASSESDIAEVENLQSSIAPDACFSIQFTSGTTGKPKAARLSHFSVVNCGYDMGKILNEIISRIVANACNEQFIHQERGTSLTKTPTAFASITLYSMDTASLSRL